MIENWRDKTARELGRTANHVYLAPHALLRGKVAHYTVWTAPGMGGLGGVSGVLNPGRSGGLNGLGNANGEHAARGTAESGGVNGALEHGKSGGSNDAQEPSVAEALTLVPDAAGCIVLYWDSQCRVSLWGPTTRAVTVSSEGAPVRLFIEFLPGGLFYLLGECQAELADGRFAAEELAPRLAQELCAAVERARDTAELAAGFDAVLLPRMLTRTPPPAALSAAAALFRAQGLLSVRELSTQECYSPRHLNRVLGPYLGVGPKEFARLLRVNLAVRRLGSGLPLTRLAQEAGFYDQPHFIRDFKIICGTTPGFCRENMTDFYKEPFKL